MQCAKLPLHNSCLAATLFLWLSVMMRTTSNPAFSTCFKTKRMMAWRWWPLRFRVKKYPTGILTRAKSQFKIKHSGKFAQMGSPESSKPFAIRPQVHFPDESILLLQVLQMWLDSHLVDDKGTSLCLPCVQSSCLRLQPFLDQGAESCLPESAADKPLKYAAAWKPQQAFGPDVVGGTCRQVA